MTIQKLSKLITPQQAAEVLGVKLETLAVWRATKRYPLPYVKVGRKVFYKTENIEKFIEDGIRNIKEVHNV
jgi:excisionase family DNA binding protein